MATVQEQLRLIGLSLAHSASEGDLKAVAKWAAKATALTTPHADAEPAAVASALNAEGAPVPDLVIPADPYKGQGPLVDPELLAFKLAHSAEIDAAYLRFQAVEAAALEAAGLPTNGALSQAQNIALAESVNASILRVAGFFGPETPGVSK